MAADQPMYVPEGGGKPEIIGDSPSRDRLAAMAMVGLLADESSGGTGDQWTPERLAVRAYEIADAMIAERDKVQDAPEESEPQPGEDERPAVPPDVRLPPRDRE